VAEPKGLPCIDLDFRAAGAACVEQLALLGHLIGDGCTLPRHAIQYTTNDRSLARLVAELGFEDLPEDAVVLLEWPDRAAGVEGRAAHQGPEVDGTTTVRESQAELGQVVAARVVETDGADLVAEPV
jgi:hypothetical protein